MAYVQVAPSGPIAPYKIVDPADTIKRMRACVDILKAKYYCKLTQCERVD
jgi:hypothetical protein